MDNYISVKEFAERSGVSKQAIYQKLNGSLKPYTRKIKGHTYISVEALKEFYDIQGDFNQDNQGIKEDSTKDSQEIQHDAAEETKSTEPETDVRDEMIQLLKSQIQQMNDQLDRKDQQINEQAAQLRSKDNQINKLHELLEHEQQLRMVQEQRLMLEAESSTAEEVTDVDKNDAAEEEVPAAEVVNSKPWWMFWKN